MTVDEAKEIAKETLVKAMTVFDDELGGSPIRVELMDSIDNEVAFNITSDDDEDVDVIAIYRIELG